MLAILLVCCFLKSTVMRHLPSFVCSVTKAECTQKQETQNKKLKDMAFTLSVLKGLNISFPDHHGCLIFDIHVTEW